MIYTFTRALRPLSSLFLLFALVFGIGFRVSAEPVDPAKILGETELTGGLVVHLGCGDATQSEKFLANDGFRVHGLDSDPEKVAAARDRLLKNASYGKIVVDRLLSKSLPYAENIVNLLVAEDADLTSESEILRVLVPRGFAFVRQADGDWKKIRESSPRVDG